MQHLGVGEGIQVGSGRPGVGVWEHQATQGDDVTPSTAVGSLMAAGGRQEHSVYACWRVCSWCVFFVLM